MHCRLPQQVPSSKEAGGFVNRKPQCHSKGHICRIWHTTQVDISCWYKFVSDRFRNFCSSLNIKQAVSSAYNHQSNGQVEACIKFIKNVFKNVQIPVGISTWLYYKYILPHWAKACQACQHYYSIAWSAVSCLS